MDTTTINEYILKLTGKVNLPESLEMGHSYKVLIDGEITQVTDSNNQDGTINKSYKFEPLICEVQKDNGDTIKAKDPRKNSVKIRKVCYAIWATKQTDKTADEVYDKVTNIIIQNMETFIDKIL